MSPVTVGQYDLFSQCCLSQTVLSGLSILKFLSIREIVNTCQFYQYLSFLTILVSSVEPCQFCQYLSVPHKLLFNELCHYFLSNGDQWINVQSCVLRCYNSQVYSDGYFVSLKFIYLYWILRLSCCWSYGSLMSLYGPTFYVTPVDLCIIFQCNISCCIMACGNKIVSIVSNMQPKLEWWIKIEWIVGYCSLIS